MREGADYFAVPAGPAQRRYEALRAYFLDELPAAEVADRFGYSTASVHQMATLLRKGRLGLFTETRPGPKGPRKATGQLRARALELREPLRRALDGVHAVLAEQAGFDPALDDRVFTIAASDYVQYALLVPLRRALKKSAPRMRLAWRALDVPSLSEQTERGAIDLAIMTPATAPPHLRTRALFDEHYVCIARRDHPRLRRKLDLDAFVALEHVVVSPRGGGFTGPVDAALQALHRSRRVAMSVSNFLVVPEIVARSDMVAVVPARLVNDRKDRLIVRAPPLAVEGFSIGMVWHERDTAHPAHRWLREQIAALE